MAFSFQTFCIYKYGKSRKLQIQQNSYNFGMSKFVNNDTKYIQNTLQKEGNICTINNLTRRFNILMTKRCYWPSFILRSACNVLQNLLTIRPSTTLRVETNPLVLKFHQTRMKIFSSYHGKDSTWKRCYCCC